ncbi:MAG: homoserine dehydrogenase [Rhodospirillales bacterium]|nr:homoserine dehydrogenase [Rhodospirillales bacterium]
MTGPLKIGIAGLGTVGAGVLEILHDNQSLIAARAGRGLVVTAVSARDKSRDRGVSTAAFTWFDNAADLADQADVDVVVELIGGSDGIAKTLAEKALGTGKHLVTANKALIAHHGVELGLLAEKADVCLSFEAAVAGGIPIVKALRDGLAANRVQRLYGILNGTCNYILTNMADSGRAFADVLAEAQALGYAETDPSFDVDGVDAAHKLAILASIAFGTKIDFESVHVEGIRNVSPIDIDFAKRLGYGIKLLGVAKQTPTGIEQRVHPCMVPVRAPINHVSGVYNGVVVDGDFVDSTIYEGRGAGAGPTASAVVTDLIDIARGLRVPAFGIATHTLKEPVTVPMSDHRGPYYAHLIVVDKPGVFAEFAACLRDHNVSMEQVLQQSRDPGEPVDVVMTVHETRESDMVNCLEDIAKIEAVVAPPTMIRIEML